MASNPKQTIVSITPLPVRADSRTFKQASSLGRLGYRSIVVEGTHSGDGFETPFFELIRTCTESTGNPVGRTTARGKKPGAVLGKPFGFISHAISYVLKYFLRTIRNAPTADLYYLHHFYQFPAVALLCRIHGSRFIYDAHDFYSQIESDANLSFYWRKCVRPCERFLERVCVRKASAVVTVNDGIAQLMAEEFGRQPFVLRNAHDARIESPVERTIRDVTGVGKDEFLTVCIGQWKTGMAIEEAISAIAALPPKYHLVFLGMGFPSYEALCAAKNISGRVHFLDPVEPAEVVSFIRTADAGIVLYYPASPNFEHCLPNGFFQPVAAGLPLLYPELPEIVALARDHGLGVAIDPQNPVSIAQGMHALGEKPEEVERFRYNIEMASDALSWQRDEEVLRDLVKNVLGGSK